jgi:hypothetical protein
MCADASQKMGNRWYTKATFPFTLTLSHGEEIAFAAL